MLPPPGRARRSCACPRRCPAAGCCLPALLPLFTLAQSNLAPPPRSEHIIDRRTFFEHELEAEQQSRVGQRLTELTIRKVRAGGWALVCGQAEQLRAGWRCGWVL